MPRRARARAGNDQRKHGRLVHSTPIEDYALIGDCETAALVARSGSIDWLCWPRFDSSACFAALLGAPQHGRWKLSPAAKVVETRRRYAGETLILETRFECAEGAVILTDFMPVRRQHEISEIVRIVTGVRGSVPMRMELDIRFDYGRIRPWMTWEKGRMRAVAGPHAVFLALPDKLERAEEVERLEFTVSAGESVPFTLSYEASHLPAPRACDPEGALRDTHQFWSGWAEKCRYEGPWREAVMRSLITVKALTYRPTGGIVAAPTTSLPEKFGEERNWDYRYCWLRDASFCLLSLINAGYREEAEDWCNWLLRAIACDPAGVQPLYGLGGEQRISEQTLDWLPGYAGSRPVRIGNAAYDQLQIDVFGNILDAVYQARLAGLSLHADWTRLIPQLLDHLDEVWTQPDEGIWEVRGPPQHFVHAKMMAWVAYDRAILLAEAFDQPGPVAHWRDQRSLIRAEIMQRGFDRERGVFVQAYGRPSLDAALLLMPLMGFLSADDPRMVATAEAIERELSRADLVHRYDTDEASDGLSSEEGAFLACSFWLADNKLKQGKREAAESLFRRLLSLRNDVGLLAEQYDSERGAMTGNFPQAFSHFAMIDTALRLSGHEEC